MIDGQESISIPVAYIETFVMTFGAFLIGYVGAMFFSRQAQKKSLAKYEKKITSLEEQLNALRENLKLATQETYRKDRMDQDYEQLKIRERAFSEEVLRENTQKEVAINFDRIGRSQVSDRDDLQKIVGIGPYTEAKLNDMGIYTFEQISRFTNEDIETVTELIKFFPDRIKNDRWVTKARDLYLNKTSQNPDDTKKKTMNEKSTL